MMTRRNCAAFVLFGAVLCAVSLAGVKGKTTCQREAQQSAARAKKKLGTHVPQCDAKGAFKPLQKDSKTGYRWCVDKHGHSIPGTHRAPGTPNPTCKPGESICKAATEHAASLEKECKCGMYIPQCDRNGDFKPLQVWKKDGSSWCATKHNGVIIFGTRRAGGQKHPRCPPGKTPCQKAAEKAKKRKGIHWMPQCDEEGAYNELQKSNGKRWCVDKNGRTIRGTMRLPGKPDPFCDSEELEAKRKPCKLAVEEANKAKLDTGEKGIYIPQCDSKGQFKPLQRWAMTGDTFCVDKHGDEIPKTRTKAGKPPPKCK